MKLIILIDNLFSAIADITVELKDQLVFSSLLLAEALIFTVLFGLTIGMLGARKPNGFFDRFTGTIGGILSGFPSFLLAFPASLLLKRFGLADADAAPVQQLLQQLPVAFTIALPEILLLATLMKNVAVREWNGAYVDTIRNTGCPDGKIYSKHIKKAAFLPVLKYAGKVIADLFASIVVVEFLLTLKGAGAGYTVYSYLGNYKNAGVIIMWALLLALAVKLIFDIVYYTVESENAGEIHNKLIVLSAGRYNFKCILGCVLAGLIVLTAALGLLLNGESLPESLIREYGFIIIRLWLPALVAVAAACAAGAAIGLLTGLIGGPVDRFITGLNSTLAGIPCLLVALPIISAFGKNIYAPAVTVAIALVPGFAYAFRGELASKWNMKASRKTKFKYSRRIRLVFDRVLPNSAENIPAALVSALSLATFLLCFIDFVCSPKTIFAPSPAIFDISLKLGLANHGELSDIGLLQLLPVPIMLIALRLIYDSFACSPAAVTIKGKKLAAFRLEAAQALTRENEADSRRDRLVQRTTVNEYTEAPAAAVTEKFPEKTDSPAVFAVENLSLGMREKNEWRIAIKNLSFTMHRGESAFICCDHESGSLLAKQIMGLELGAFCRIGGKLQLVGTELTGLSGRDYADMRGKQLAMANIGSRDYLDPIQRVGMFAEEILENHGLPGSGAGGNEALYREVVYSAFAEAGIDEPEELFDMYPDELSQEEADIIQLAAASVCEPKLLLVLMKGPDAKLSTACLNIIKRLETTAGTAVLIITESDDIRRNAICREIKIN